MKLKEIKIETPLGEMLAVAHDDALILLEFFDSENIERDLTQIEETFETEIQEGENLPLKQIRNELEDYFKHPFASFKTPVEFIGTDFQKQVWEELRTIPSGGTSTYSEIAEKINNENAARAVANALNANKLAIIVPCHRVIGANNNLTGYTGGIDVKVKLLNLEGIDTAQYKLPKA